MKPLFLAFVVASVLAATVDAQLPAAKPGAKLPALTPKDLRDFPYAREFRDRLFKATDRSVGDELRASLTAAGLHIWGKKKAENVHFDGRPVGHMGRVALLPLGDRSGKLTVKVPSSLDVTYYMIVFETADGKLDAKELTLATGKTYTWSVKAESGTVSYVVNEGATAVAKLSSPQANVKSFGFASTVRYKGNESDILATFDPQ